MSTEERPCKCPVRRWPTVNQGERSQRNQTFYFGYLFNFFLVYSCFTMFCYFLQETRPWSKRSILQNCAKATFCGLSHLGSVIFCYPSPRKFIQGLLSSKDTFSNRGFICSNWAFRRWNKLTLWSFNHLSNLRFVLFCSTISFFGPYKIQSLKITNFSTLTKKSMGLESEPLHTQTS